MEVNESVLYQATKMFNWTEEEAKEKLFDGDGLKDDYADVLLEADKERIDGLKKQRETKYNEGFQTAEKKFKTHAEESFKKLTGYKGDEGNFEDMFQLWYADEKKKLATKKEVSEDEVKKTSWYIALESERIPKKEYDELKESFDQFKTTLQKDKVMGVVTDRAWAVVSAKNPILSENQSVADNRRRDFLAKFHGYEYELADDKIIVSKDGKRLEDAHGNSKTFEAVVLELAELNFDFKAQSDRENAGNRNSGGGGGVIVITDKPTTKEEYHKALDKYEGAGEERAKMRIALRDYYHANKKD